jgi:hypothetical protein
VKESNNSGLTLINTVAVKLFKRKGGIGVHCSQWEKPLREPIMAASVRSCFFPIFVE